jgi:4-aminobutyrate aminotransferase-like enzyme
MDLYPPGSMTSTHSASPLPVVAAIENLKIIRRENLASGRREDGRDPDARAAAHPRAVPGRAGLLPARAWWPASRS